MYILLNNFRYTAGKIGVMSKNHIKFKLIFYRNLSGTESVTELDKDKLYNL